MTHRHHGILLPVVVTVFALAASACSSGSADPAEPSRSPTAVSSPGTSAAPRFAVTAGPPVPATGAYFGAWVMPRPYSQPARVEAIRGFEKSMGRKLDIVHLYRTWEQPVGTSSDLTFARAGYYLLLSWSAADTRRINSGAEDALIRQRAREVRALPTQVFLRWRWEMDRPNLTNVVHSASEYVRAWRHIRALFEAENVRNVGWVWCPTGAGFSTGRAEAYYPGDDEVDWVCADIYPEKPWVKGSYEPFGVLAEPFLRWAADRRKPVMIGEYGVPRTYGSKRARWLVAAQQYMRESPHIKAVVYFAADPPDRPVEDHMDVLHDPAATAALAKTAGDPWFNPRR